MAKFLGVDIARELNKVVGPLVNMFMLTRFTFSTRDATQLTAGVDSFSGTYTFNGYLSDYDDFQIDGTAIKRGDRKIVLFSDSIDSTILPPIPGDEIDADRVYQVVKVFKDPSGATYECQVRGAAVQTIPLTKGLTLIWNIA